MRTNYYMLLLGILHVTYANYILEELIIEMLRRWNVLNH